jgi:hypothetical protein
MAATCQGGDPARVSVQDVIEIDNTNAGGDYGRMVQFQRVLDGEELYAIVTP